MRDSFTTADVEQSTMQLIVDQLEELVVTIIEEVRQRPGVAVAILAGILGAVFGSMLAARSIGRRRSPARRIVRKARSMGDAGELVAVALKLMQNPLVRGFISSAVESQLKKRLSL